VPTAIAGALSAAEMLMLDHHAGRLHPVATTGSRSFSHATPSRKRDWNLLTIGQCFGTDRRQHRDHPLLRKIGMLPASTAHRERPSVCTGGGERGRCPLFPWAELGFRLDEIRPSSAWPRRARLVRRCACDRYAPPRRHPGQDDRSCRNSNVFWRKPIARCSGKRSRNAYIDHSWTSNARRKRA